MNLGHYFIVFLVIILGLALVVAYPFLADVEVFQENSEGFSEFWLLGPGHATEVYPFNVTEGELQNIFVCLTNRMGSSEQYRIYVKFGNSTQTQVDRFTPFALPSLYEFQASVGDEASWESPVAFEFQNVAIEDNVVIVDNVTKTLPLENSILSVGGITINGIDFPVDVSTSWDSKNRGFYFRLSFELWIYDAAINSFSFHDRVVGLRLNMTVPQQTETATELF